MRAFFIALFLVAFAIPSSAIVEPVQPSGPDAAADIQITSLSMDPNSVPLGSTVEFTLSLRSFSNSVTSFSPKIYVFNTAGSLADSISFGNASIAGGEKQSFTGHMGTSGKPPGAYNAYAEVSFDSTKLRSGVLLFSIYSPSENGSASGPIVPRAISSGPPSEKPAPSSPVQKCEPSCGQWGECSGGFRRSSCSYPAGCDSEPFTSVESCPASESEEGTGLPPAEKGFWEWALALAAAPLLLALIAGAFLLLRKKFGRRKGLGGR
jgi:hypothetical protein